MSTSQLLRFHATREFRRCGRLWTHVPVMVAIITPGEALPMEAQVALSHDQYAALCKERDRDPQFPIVMEDPSEAELRAAAKLAKADQMQREAEKDLRSLEAVRIELEDRQREIASLELQKDAVMRALAEAQEKSTRAEQAARQAEERLEKANQEREAVEEQRRSRKK